MTRQGTCLSVVTRAKLERLSESVPVRRTISCHESVTVGVSTSTDLPSAVVLPWGLDWQDEPSTVVNDILTSESTPLPEVVALRYRAELTVSALDPEKTVRAIETAAVVAIDAKPFAEETLGELVTSRGVDHVCEITLYLSPLKCLSAVEGKHHKSPPLGPEFTAAFEEAAPIVSVPIDAVAYCRPSASAEDVTAAIATAVRRIMGVLASATDETTGGSPICCQHFPILGSGLCVTIVHGALGSNLQRSCEAVGDSETVKTTSLAFRKRIHNTLCLPDDRPLFRAVCRAFIPGAVITAYDGGWPGRLRDIHLGIKSHGLGSKGVTQRVVEGSYLYCHYLQDKKGDSGWGCAYRSLQTLFSWCVLQRYVSTRNVPTHAEIQRALVTVGDKPPSFIGTSEWIGANEVCYALEQLTGISSRIFHVSRGSEMGGISRDLLQHFEQHGSPVMVGGGVLAWTIVGVARNDRTGKAKFLIVDPHYEGREDLKTIQTKGWVSWKSEDAFVSEAFYNLCLPQRPKWL